MENYRVTGTCSALLAAALLVVSISGVAAPAAEPANGVSPEANLSAPPAEETAAGYDLSTDSVQGPPLPTGPPDPDLLEKVGATIEADENAEEDVPQRGSKSAPLDFSQGPPAALAQPVNPCNKFSADYDSWLDQGQMGLYRSVCGATVWFDGFFGDLRYDQTSGQTFGRVSIGEFWDELDGFDTSLRFRARFALPALNNRTSLLIGRGDEAVLVDERLSSGSEQLARQSTSQTGDATIVGLGYQALESLKRDLNFSVGARLSSGLVGVSKVKYRRAWQLTDRDLLQLLPLLYWRSDEGLGATLRVDADHVINRRFLVRWSNFVNVSENKDTDPVQDDDPATEDFVIDGVNWGSTFNLFQALSKKRGITYTAFVTGTSDANVPYQNAGFELRYRQRILREWLFIEYITGINWPRQYYGVERERNFGLGLRLEAYFGPAPDAWML